MNQKNHFVSTYQKDYAWPHAPGVCRAEPSTKPIAIKFCPCTDSRRVLKELLDASLEEHLDRDRTKPKVYPKTRPILRVRAFDWPSSVFMKKVEKECSDPYESLVEKICPDERTARTDAERFKTTYQAHYSDPAARMTQRDLAQPIIHMKDQQLRCRMPIKITIETDCPPHCHPSSSRVNASVKHRQDYKLKNGSRRDKKCEIVNGQTSLPSWRSEYQDNISKIGHAIMRVKLHHAKRKAIPLQYQHCTTSN
ncbi:unnamed protein product [Lasius platythorax]|uniref:Uncharacterized protein n=1 Tax=Lasius platythorax TaxID=488582 RepID=A0AAV2N0G4_9HYME